MKISGWGKYPIVRASGHGFETSDELRRCLETPGDMIAYAMGRSYGDSALNERICFTRRFDKMLDFDARTGLLTCESGVSLADVVARFLPRGWFLTVTPGTKYISVGGAIAGDVHGKNHHSSGCFSESLISFDLMLPDGKVVTCSKDENALLFRATCGGMGLTGIILRATIQLQPVASAWIRETIVRCPNLDAVFDAFEAYASAPYSVAWIDCLAKGEHLGRSVLMLGAHAQSGSLQQQRSGACSIPFDLPGFCLNRYSITFFNHLYYHRRPAFTEGRLIPLEGFFYPLDKIHHWNRMYGSRGFTQYQLVLPKAAGFKGMRRILTAIADSGQGSFLGVLKLLGPQNDNDLSFPMEGYTLALDFKIRKNLFPLLDELDRIVLDYGGRLYLAKDVRMPGEVFRKGYPHWERFVHLRQQMNMDEKFNSLQSRRLGV